MAEAAVLPRTDQFNMKEQLSNCWDGPSWVAEADFFSKCNILSPEGLPFRGRIQNHI